MAGVQTCALPIRSEEHTSELQSHLNLVCRLLLEKKKCLIHQPSTPTVSRIVLKDATAGAYRSDQPVSGGRSPPCAPAAHASVQRSIHFPHPKGSRHELGGAVHDEAATGVLTLERSENAIQDGFVGPGRVVIHPALMVCATTWRGPLHSAGRFFF